LSGLADILFGATFAILFPLIFLPLTALAAGRAPRAAGFFFVILVAVAAGTGYAFAWAAVDLVPPAPSPSEIAGVGLITIGLAGAVQRFGAAALTARLAGVFETATRRAGRATLALVFMMALVQFTVVILRYVFGVNFIFLQESVTYLHGAVFLLAGGYALLTNDHVRVDIFYGAAPPRRKALADFLGTYLFLFPFCLITLATAGPYVANAWTVREGSTEQSGIQGIYLLKTLIPMFALLLALAGFVAAAKAAAVLKSGEGTTDPAGARL